MSTRPKADVGGSGRRCQRGLASTRPVPLVLAVLAMLSLVLGGCSTGGEPATTTLAVLASEQEAWNGRVVRTEGIVRSYVQPLHVWVEDDEVNRVEVRPVGELLDLVGERVRVTGTFSFDDRGGRYIEVESLEVLDGR